MRWLYACSAPADDVGRRCLHSINEPMNICDALTKAHVSVLLLCLMACVSCSVESHDIPAQEEAQGRASQGAGKLIHGDDPTDASVMGTATGPYATMMYTDGYRRGMKYADSTIVYPLDAKPPFAETAIVPGSVSPQSSIISWGPFLASFGIVTMTIGTNSLSDPPEVREEALLDALETLKSEHARTDSPLHGRLALDRLATMGWSMGGGGTLLAADEHPELKRQSRCAPGIRVASLRTSRRPP